MAVFSKHFILNCFNHRLELLGAVCSLSMMDFCRHGQVFESFWVAVAPRKGFLLNVLF